MSLTKKWNHDPFDAFEDNDAFQEVTAFQEGEDVMQEQKEEDNPPIFMSSEEMQEEGFYNVEEILKHKFKQGWRFLTHWEGYPITSSTWEPIKSFILPSGALNEKFQEYCERQDLREILRKALALRQ